MAIILLIATDKGSVKPNKINNSKESLSLSQWKSKNIL